MLCNYQASNWFPYVKKRILVVYEKTIDLNPLETAIDELEQKSEAFESILKKKDLTLLELYLQGAIIPQVRHYIFTENSELILFYLIYIDHRVNRTIYSLYIG